MVTEAYIFGYGHPTPRPPPGMRGPGKDVVDCNSEWKIAGYIPVIGTIVGVFNAIVFIDSLIEGEITPIKCAGGIFRAALELVPGVGLLVLLPVDIIVTNVRTYLHNRQQRRDEVVQPVVPEQIPASA